MSEQQTTCTECARPVGDWPMAFRGDPQCSVLCQKAAENKPVSVPEEQPLVTMTADE